MGRVCQTSVCTSLACSGCPCCGNASMITLEILPARGPPKPATSQKPSKAKSEIVNVWINYRYLSVQDGQTSFCQFRKKTAKSLKNAEGIKKAQTADSQCAEMIQKPAISTKNTASGQRAKTGFFVAIPIIKTTPNSAERRSGFVQRSFHSALRSAMCATKTYMLCTGIFCCFILMISFFYYQPMNAFV